MGVREEPDDGLAHDLQVVLLVSGDRGPDELQAVFSQRCMLQEEPAKNKEYSIVTLKENTVNKYLLFYVFFPAQRK